MRAEMCKSVAILHDQLTTAGGAEQVTWELARALDADVIAARVDDEIVPDDITTIELWPDGLPARLLESHYLVQDLWQMIGWQHVEPAYDYDVIVLAKNNPGWFVPREQQTVVKFTHSTPRGQYDQFHRHGRGILSRVLKTPMRILYRPNIAYVDGWMANSELVQRRLNAYWGIDEAAVTVAYPPIDTASYGPEHAEGGGGYYFTYSRLEGHKRIDTLVRAFNQLPPEYRLIIGGKGRERDALEELAGPSVEFVGYMDEAEKRRRLAECEALLFNAENEDCGIVPFEAFASGTPVIGVRDGYTEHQVMDGVNGVLFDRGVENVGAAVRRLDREGVDWDADRIQQFAERFDRREFVDTVRTVVEDTVARTAVETPWERERARAQEAAEPLRADGGPE